VSMGLLSRAALEADIITPRDCSGGKMNTAHALPRRLHLRADSLERSEGDQGIIKRRCYGFGRRAEAHFQVRWPWYTGTGPVDWVTAGPPQADGRKVRAPPGSALGNAQAGMGPPRRSISSAWAVR